MESSAITHNQMERGCLHESSDLTCGNRWSLAKSQREFHVFIFSPIPFMEINSAEILAIHRAVKITLSCEALKTAKLTIESDSANAVQWCNSEEGGPWNLNFHLNFIRNARKGGLDVSIIHKGRNSNFVADSMAKQGLHRHSEFIAWMWGRKSVGWPVHQGSWRYMFKGSLLGIIHRV